MSDAKQVMSERSIFLAALDIAEPSKRAAYLNRACGNDAALRRHIEELIAAEAMLGGFLDRPHADVERTDEMAPVVERPGAQIGPYKLLEQIGEGGFGIVFMAEQQHPMRRKVALKILKAGMDTRQVIARFEAERQALALMDHPNIARVLDAGETSSGRPYFVMELVKGMPITQFCDEGQLTTRERLELFVSVCQAAQHAHQKGIIHRDIKPTNVLVTLHDGTPVVKVIDFGVAKATGYQLTEKTLFTGFAQMIGTPLYMSPEQAALSGLDIDTRSDIYSLGVLLYELLTGTTPLQGDRLKKAAFDEIRRIIREEEAIKPSTRISTLGATATSISALRKTEPQKLSQLLRNELDWIVMKSLEKDRTRRYETASAFAADVGRYLRDEQVEACPPSTLYRLRKFARRNRAALTTGIAFFCSMFVLSVLSFVLAYVARHQRDRARLATREMAVARRDAESQRDQAVKARSEESRQRQLAEEREAEAKTARLAEADQRRQAEASEQAAMRERNSTLAAKDDLRHTLYAAEMNLVQLAWDGRQFGRVEQLLKEQPPDLRGFEWHYWQHKLHRGRLQSVKVAKLRTIDPYRRRAIAFSRGGRRLAAIVDYPDASLNANGFGLLAIFDGASGRELITPLDLFSDWREGLRKTRLLAMSDDGTRLAVTLGFSGEVRSTDTGVENISIRDGETGQEVRSLPSPGRISEIVLTPDGSRLAVHYVESDESLPIRKSAIKIWDTSTGNLVTTFPGLSRSLPGLLWSPDGGRLLRKSYETELADGRVSDPRNLLRFQVLDVASGNELWRREFPQTLVSSFNPWAWTRDGKFVVTAHARGVPEKPNLQLWDAETGATLAIFDRESESPIDDATIDFTPDGRHMAALSTAHEIFVWDLPQTPRATTEGPLRIAAPQLTLRPDGEEVRALRFSGDGQKLYSAGHTSLITWDATTREDDGLGPDATARFFGSYSNRWGAISKDASKMALSGSAFPLEYVIWDLKSDRELCRLKPNNGGFNPEFRPDGARIALARSGDTPEPSLQITIIDTQTGEALHEIPVESAGRPFIDFGYRPDGQQLAALVRPPSQESHVPSRLLAWDANTQRSLFAVNLKLREGYRPQLLGYSPDGSTLTVAAMALDPQRDSAVVSYDSATGDEQNSITLPNRLRAIAVDFAGKSILAKASSVEPGKPDAIYTRSDIVVLDWESGQERLRLRGHGGFDHFDVTPDGSRIVLGLAQQATGGASTFSIWSLKSGRRLLEFNRQGLVSSVSFSPDGNRLIASFSQSTTRSIKLIQIWDATPLPEDVAK